MLYLLFQLSTSIHYITLTNQTQSLLLQFNPLDVIEVEVKAGFATFFGGWEYVKNLNIEIEMLTEKGKTYIYGPYKNEDEVYGVFFQSSDYVIRFMNDNADKVKFAIRTDKYLLSEKVNIFPNYQVLYQKNETLKLKLTEISDPIIFAYWEKNTYLKNFIFFISIAGLLYIIYNIVFCIKNRSCCHYDENLAEEMNLV